METCPETVRAPNLDCLVASMTLMELVSQLYRDPTTGVLNRRAYDVLAHNVPLAIVDLDSLKWVNDTLGHRSGDALLKRLADALRTQFGDANVFRLSGDEFAVLANEPNEVSRKLGMLQRWLPCYSFGVGQDLVRADSALRENKLTREVNGDRASRGEIPPWAGIVA